MFFSALDYGVTLCLIPCFDFPETIDDNLELSAKSTFYPWTAFG